MSAKSVRLGVWTGVACLCLAACGTARAASGTWTGTQNGAWTNSANWSASPYAGYNTNEKATFDNAGNGNTVLDIAGLYSIGSITFDTANVASYTIGAGAVNSQTVVIGANGVYYLSATAGHSQLFNAALQLGGSNVSGSYFIRNEHATETLTFAGNVTAGSGSSAGTKTLSCVGAGSVVFSGNLSKGAASALVLTNALAGTLTLSGSNSLQTLHLTGATATEIGGGFLGLANTGNLVLNAAGDGAVNGTGKIWLSSTVAAGNDNVVVADGKELAVNVDFSGAAGATLAKGGSGALRLTAACGFPGALAVDGGTLTLSGVNGALASVASVSVATGGVLSVENSGAASLPSRLSDAAPITLTGGTLSYAHSGGASSYGEALGALVIAGPGSVVSASRAAEGYASAVTFADLARGNGGTVNFVGEGLGEDSRNRIFIAGQPNGFIGLWATVNGAAPAAYDSVKGVYAATGATEIAARGPDSVIPDDPFADVRITAPGVSGPIALAGDPVSRVGVLRQQTNEPATVSTASKTFQASTLQIGAGQGPLTIGEAVGDGALCALKAGGPLALVNESASALTVNAAIADNTSASALFKDGPGDALLKGPVGYSGPTAINAGRLTFYADAVTQTVTGVVSGSGALAKGGTNALCLRASNAYTGPTYIDAGLVRPNADLAFGTAAGGVFIADGATLDVGCTADVGGTRNANALSLQGEEITVAGAGLFGQGAIVNSSTASQWYATGKVNLSGDALFSTRSRWDIRDGWLKMNDHAVTKVGGDTFSLSSVEVTPGAAGTASFDVQQGALRLQRTTQLNGSASNTVRLRSGASVAFYDLVARPAWSLVFEDGASYSISSATSATHNVWGGPVTLNGTALLTADGSFSGGFAGTISGAGSLVKTNDHTFYITSTNNTYTGPTWIAGGYFYVASLRNLGEACSLGQPTTVDSGTIRLGAGGTNGRLYYTGTGDTTDRVLDMTGTTGGAVLNHSGSGRLTISKLVASGAGSKTVYLQGSTSGVGEISGMITNGLVSGSVSLSKQGTGAWVLSGNNRYTGSTTVDDGSLTFTGFNILPGNTTVNGGALTYAGTNALAGALSVNQGAVVVTGTNVYGTGDLFVGATNRIATLTLAAGSSLSGSGSFRFGNPGGSGALYLNGGTVARTQGAGDQNFVFGRDSGAYGYLRMTAGSVSAGRFQMGGVNVPQNVARGLARVSGGTLTFTDYLLFARNPGCESVLTMDGGTLLHVNAANNFCLAFAGGRSEVNLTGGAIDNTGKNLTFGQNAAGGTGIVNVCAGRLTTDTFSNPFAAGGFLNFAGGTLAASLAGTTFVPTNLTAVYSYGPFSGFAGGAVIDSNGKAVTIPAAIRAPTGQGVASIALASPGSGYVGEPYVAIEGDGYGATAVANLVDDGSGSNTFKLASVTVTCPGVNYTTPPAVTFRGGCGTNAALAAVAGAVTLAPAASGGLTKTGAGTLTLTGANTYTGATTVAGGTLKLGAAGALVPNTPVALAGGTLDLGGLTVTNAVAGSGTLTNGTAVAVLSPGGEGTVATNALTLLAASVRGTYRADVTAGGACDLLTVQGALDLSKFTLSLVNPALLDNRRSYTVLSCAGGLTGTFAATNLPDSHWHVAAFPDGTVRLVFSKGTVLVLF